MEKMLQVAGVALALVTLLLSGPGGQAQRKTAADHARAGWNAINAGQPQEAAAAFDEALTEAPEAPPVLLGAGLAAHLLGRGDAARRFLIGALKQEPALTPASLLLGEVLYRAGDLSGAIQAYNEAISHAPAHPQLLARVEAWRKEAALHDGFTQKVADHFTVLFEGPAEAQLAAKAVEALEAAYWRIGSALYTYPADVITVVLYTREQFRDVTRSPDWAGGAYDGRIRVPVRDALKNVRELERVLAHEFTHALVRTLAPRGVPQWLDEGLAMNFDGTDLTAQIERSSAVPGALTALELPFSAMSSDAAALAYAHSAAAVKRLLEIAGPPAIVGILADIARGLAFAEAFERNVNISYAEFQKEFQEPRVELSRCCRHNAHRTERRGRHGDHIGPRLLHFTNSAESLLPSKHLTAGSAEEAMELRKSS